MVKNKPWSRNDTQFHISTISVSPPYPRRVKSHGGFSQDDVSMTRLTLNVYTPNTTNSNSASQWNFSYPWNISLTDIFLQHNTQLDRSQNSLSIFLASSQTTRTWGQLFWIGQVPNKTDPIHRFNPTKSASSAGEQVDIHTKTQQ